MGWTFTPIGVSSPRNVAIAGFPQECIAHIIVFPGSDVPGVVREMRFGTEVGRITISSSGAKLEAISQALSILPGQADSDHAAARYELQPGDSARSEVFLLRHGDTIHVLNRPGGLLCKWDVSEVQVNSSAAPDLAVSNVDDNEQGVTETPDDEMSDDDEDLDNTIDVTVTTQTKTSQRPQATPKLSAQPSVVVEETPTAARVNGFTAYSHSNEQDLQDGESRHVTPLDEPEIVTVEQYSTARTGESQHASEMPAITVADIVLEDVPRQATTDGSHMEPTKRPFSPRIVIPPKRDSPNPANDDSESDVVVQRPIKRRRGNAAHNVEDDAHDSRLKSSMAEEGFETTPSRRRARQKSVDQGGADTPQSQHSNASVQTGAYDGPKPCVALSNSSIVGSGATVKFLKKQGGVLVESVKDDFNILCVRDGSLHKTAKVLRAVATGAHIVTDNWLIKSATAEQFLPIEDYRPNASKQESEWRFSLKDISGIPQRPFLDRTIHFTSKLHSQYSSFAEIEQVCLAAGAGKITKKKQNPSADSIVLVADDGDEEAEKFIQDGTTCYVKDLIPISIFRGKLDLDSDEFKVKDATPRLKKTKKGRKS